jgi:xanthine dehydrogenase accessory factor
MNTPEEFAALYAGAHRLATTGGGAMATLLRTRGPVFRRAGARMLIGRDGSIVRGLSAGCPEADLVARARALFDGSGSCIVRYDREHGFDALLELGCGGEMEILLETFADAGQLGFLDAVDALLQRRRNGWLATLYTDNGACLPQPRRLIWSDQTYFDSLGAPALSSRIIEQCGGQDGTTRVAGTRVVIIGHAGRSFEVLLEPLQPPLALLLIGRNTGSMMLGLLGASLGWQVMLVDHRDDGGPLPAGITAITAAPHALAQRAVTDARTAAVVMTHNLERDLDYLAVLSALPLGYLGALGSRSRAQRMRAVTAGSATPLHAPAGLDIGSETPEQIALAIAAEIQAAIHGRSGGSLSSGDGPIH